MRLDAWLRKDPSLVERLQLVQQLALAVNAAHERGQLLAALEPSRVEVASGGACDLEDAAHGTPAAEYRAPEREGTAPSSTAADVYAAGVIVWEVLVGRPYAPSPTHLSQARPDLPGDLADGVMACLERSPEWRPRDLAYVAQLAEQAAAQRGGAARPAPRPTSPPRVERARRTRSPRPVSSPRGGEDGGRSTRLALIVAGLALAAAGGGYYWMTRGTDGSAALARPPVQPPLATPPAVTEPTATGEAPAATAEPATTSAAPPAPIPVPGATPTATPTPRPTPTPTPAVVTAPATVAARPPAPEPAAPASSIVPAPRVPVAEPPATTATTDAAAAPATSAPREPAALTTLSPLSVKRPGRVLFDLHGTGLAADLQARVIAVRDAPRGLSVLRQKCSGTLCNILVQLDDSVKPAAYAIVLEDSRGQQTNALTFTVTH